MYNSLLISNKFRSAVTDNFYFSFYTLLLFKEENSFLQIIIFKGSCVTLIPRKETITSTYFGIFKWPSFFVTYMTG